MTVGFEWDLDKDAENQQKHGVSFGFAEEAFLDPKRVIARDLAHSKSEERFYCFGSVGGGILTVQFTYPERCDSHHRRWVLAQRQANL